MVSGSLPPSLFAQLLASDQWNGKNGRGEGGKVGRLEEGEVVEYYRAGIPVGTLSRSLSSHLIYPLP